MSSDVTAKNGKLVKRIRHVVAQLLPNLKLLLLFDNLSFVFNLGTA
jgi:hypothetical protein